jgi:single-strand DNA-binding protein
MTYTGTIVFIGETKQVSDKFVTREFVLSNTEDKYPQEVKFQVTQKNCGLLDTYNLGDEVTVHYNLRGRRYEKNGTVNWYNSIEAWRFEGGKAKKATTTSEMDVDDIPF